MLINTTPHIACSSQEPAVPAGEAAYDWRGTQLRRDQWRIRHGGLEFICKQVLSEFLQKDKIHSFAGFGMN